MKSDETTKPGSPYWPGVAAALLCGFVYYWFGTQWTFRARPSLYVHHTLTAQAWLKGRTYVTAEEIERQFIANYLRRAGAVVEEGATLGELREAYDRVHSEYLGTLGVPREQMHAEVDGSLQRAFLDWVRIEDRYYAYWPPVPAAMMVPLVALLGTDFSDVVVANLLGALTVLAIFCLLVEVRALWPALTAHTCLALTLFYGLGTCHMYQASAGQVWLITQLCATLFLSISIAIGLKALSAGTESRTSTWAFVASALALSLGMLSRSTIAGAILFFAGLIWLRSRGARRPVAAFVGSAGAFGAVVLLAIVTQLAFNQVRFGDAMDLGQGRLADEGGDARFSNEFKTYGRFSPHYVPRNVWHYFLNPTIREYPAYDPAQAGLTFDPDGNSLFLISPLFVFLFAIGRCDARWLVCLALAGAGPGVVALMMYHNTGWYQFGQRYLLDVLPFLTILTALGMRGRLTRVSLALIGISILINVWGTYRYILEQG